jgi:reductive dehalogenase
MAASMAHLLFQLHLSSPDKIRPASITGTKIEMSPGQATTRVKGYAEHLGADLVGVCEIDPLWIYSHRGVEVADWGKEIELDHKYAIVVAVEMNHEMVRSAPHTPSLIESMHKYSDGVFITVQLASYIANLGYSAAANHIHHYDAPLVPLAVDAGLGELSRMGYLITKEYGPRVRLAAVTTDLPLIPDKPVDIGVWDFCEICEKCVDCCPSKSIPPGPPKEVNGILRWKLNAETCFEYWGTIGSDCCVCMRVCPWSHPRTFPHRIITELCARNNLSRRTFFKMDDIFYGKRPGSKPPPGWAGFKSD